MLVADKGIRGAVIKLGQGFEGLHFDGETVTAGGSLSFVKLSVLAGKKDYPVLNLPEAFLDRLEGPST